MTYLALIHGARGIQYFIRTHPEPQLPGPVERMPPADA